MKRDDIQVKVEHKDGDRASDVRVEDEAEIKESGINLQRKEPHVLNID